MKPLPGMVEKAILEFCIDRDQSYIIGDIGDSDMILAKNTGIRGILVRTCGGEESLIIKRLGGLMLKVEGGAYGIKIAKGTGVFARE